MQQIKETNFKIVILQIIGRNKNFKSSSVGSKNLQRIY